MAANHSEPKSKQDEEIKAFCANRALGKLAKVAAFLEDVALNDAYRDVKSVRRRDPETGEWNYEEVECAVPVNVRVTAAKTWKELIADKAIGDIKEKAKESRRDGLDMKKAMEAIAKAKAEESRVTEEEL
jgi:hypothetical protein